MSNSINDIPEAIIPATDTNRFASTHLSEDVFSSTASKTKISETMHFCEKTKKSFVKSFIYGLILKLNNFISKLKGRFPPNSPERLAREVWDSAYARLSDKLDTTTITIPKHNRTTELLEGHQECMRLMEYIEVKKGAGSVFNANTRNTNNMFVKLSGIRLKVISKLINNSEAKSTPIPPELLSELASSLSMFKSLFKSRKEKDHIAADNAQAGMFFHLLIILYQNKQHLDEEDIQMLEDNMLPMIEDAASLSMVANTGTLSIIGVMLSRLLSVLHPDLQFPSAIFNRITGMYHFPQNFNKDDFMRNLFMTNVPKLSVLKQRLNRNIKYTAINQWSLFTKTLKTVFKSADTASDETIHQLMAFYPDAKRIKDTYIPQELVHKKEASIDKNNNLDESEKAYLTPECSMNASEEEYLTCDEE